MEIVSEWLITIFCLLGGLAIFLFRMDMMCEGLQKATGERMRYILGILNKIAGVPTSEMTVIDTEILHYLEQIGDCYSYIAVSVLENQKGISGIERKKEV